MVAACSTKLVGTIASCSRWLGVMLVAAAVLLTLGAFVKVQYVLHAANASFEVSHCLRGSIPLIALHCIAWDLQDEYL